MNRPVFPPVLFMAALAVLVTFVIVCLLVRMAEHGPNFNWDSMHYISVARNLLKGNGFLEADGGRFLTWPPLYPMLLATTGALMSVDPRYVAGPLNILLFGLCIFAAGAWMRRNLNSRFLIVGGCLVVALAPSLTLAATKVLSDTAFVLFATLSLIRLDRHLADGRRSSLMWAAIFTGLAWTTRYIGVVVVVTAVAALAFRRGVPLSDKAKNIFVYSLISIAPVGIWMLRNFLIAGQPTGSPRPVDYPWLEAVEGIAGAIGGLLADTELQLLTRWLTTWSVLHVTLGGLLLLAVAAGLIVSATRARRKGRPGDGGSSFRLFSGFVILFCSFYAWTLVKGYTWHGSDLRHLIPVYIPLLFAALLTADRFLHRECQQPPAIARWAGLGTTNSLVLTLACSLSILWISLGYLRGTLAGTGTYPERDYEAMRYLRDNPSDTDLYSNTISTAYFQTVPGDGFYRGLPLYRSPDPFTPSDGHPRETLNDLLKRSWHGDRVVWIYNPDTGIAYESVYDYDDASLRAHAELRLVADLADGAVFKVEKVLEREEEEWLSGALVAEPEVRTVFDVRVRENRLVYSKTPCTRTDARPNFFLHVFPVNESDLPDDRKQHGFVNLDFGFNRGVWIDRTCAAIIALPDWEVARVATGQFINDYKRLWGGNVLWEAEIAFGDARMDGAQRAGTTTARQP